MKTYVFFAPGFEEVEGLATVDILRRGGMDVRMVAVTEGLEVTGAHGIKIVADENIADVELSDAEWLICPGGLPGADNLRANNKLCEALVAQNGRGGNIAAICASPAVVLATLGLLKGRKATCYPGFEERCEATGARMLDQYVVVDGNIITGQGPAATPEFAFAILSAARGAEKAAEVGAGMLF